MLAATRFFYGFYHHFFPARRADINFATGAGEAIAATSPDSKIGKFKAAFIAGIKFLFFSAACHRRKDLNKRSRAKIITSVKIMAAPEGIFRK